MDFCLRTSYEKEPSTDVPKTEFIKSLFSKYRATLQSGKMAKEVGGNISSNVFQLLNEDRTFKFGSDVSADFTKHTPQARHTLHKCLSQPDLLPLARGAHTASGGVKMPTNLYLPTAFMRPNKDQFHTSTDNSPRPLEGRYHTDPSYNSSGILKSFKQEFNLFGKASQVGKETASAPTSPRRASSPNLNHDLLMMQEMAESRRLSRVQEEQLPRKDSTVALRGDTSMDLANKPQVEEPKMPAPAVATDSTDGAMASSRQMPLAKSVISWFRTPQPEVAQINRQEFNAISPSSF